MNILNVEKVSKAFGEKVLLDNVTLGLIRVTRSEL